MKKNKPAPKSSVAGEFVGIKLFPVTKQRERVAYDMGMRLGFVEVYRASYYFGDVLIWLWLRTIPAEETKKDPWSVTRAEYDPEGAVKAADAWAQKIGYSARTLCFYEAFAIFKKDHEELAASKGEPVIPKGEEKDPPDSGEL